MKKLLALALCLCFALGGCAQSAPVPHTEGGGGATPEPSPAPAEAATFEKLALSLAAVPELPEEPSEAAFYDALNALDYEKLGQEGYQREYDKLWNEYSEKRDAYRAAAESLRGAGVDAALVPSFTGYTLHTLRRLAADETEKNVVYSPANLYLALCMLAETTGGESRAQLLSLLGLANVEQARSAANGIWRALYRNGATGKTLLANSIWLNQQFSIHEDTVSRLAKDYYASTFRAPMGVEATDNAIHDWINENTNHLLEDAANGLKTDANTLMMLISTLYFKGTWRDQFNKGQTSEDTFTTADGTKQAIDFMHSVKNGTYYRVENCTVAALPFQDGTAMWFLLPDEGEDIPLEQLTQPAALSDAEEGYGEIHWSVPKFDVDSDLNLIPTLQALGVVDIFDKRANFSPLTDLDALVSAVEHAARVKVDEEGCEAAAFTAITAECTSAMPEKLPIVEMDLKRPFGFLITGADSLPLFIGLVNTTEPHT